MMMVTDNGATEVFRTEHRHDRAGSVIPHRRQQHKRDHRQAAARKEWLSLGVRVCDNKRWMEKSKTQKGGQRMGVKQGMYGVV